jgi:subtilase family serine protease
VVLVGQLGRSIRRALILAAALGVLASPVPAASARGEISAQEREVIRGSVHPLARPEFDRGVSDPDLPLSKMILSLALREGASAQLTRLLEQQQDPSSENYQRWLTPDAFGKMFGAAPEDIAAAADWLASQGFRIDGTARGHTWILFSGTSRQVSDAFHTEIHDYFVDGQLHHANATEIALPAWLARISGGVVSLHDFHARVARRLSTQGPPSARPLVTLPDGSHHLSPADFWTIYNVNPLFQAGVTGQGTTIAVAARTDIDLNDVRQFRTTFGLPAQDPFVIHNGPPPGNLGGDEELEGDIDVEWAGAIAPAAAVQMVVTASTAASDGVILSAQQIIDSNSADVLSDSFILCEQQAGPTYAQFLGNLWAQAAAQGISVVVASGDSGAAGCDSRTSATAVGPAAVNAECSTPHNVCVGGTQFLDGNSPNAFWSISNRPGTMSSAVSYIPEGAWNESGSGTLDSSGGGPSRIWSKPAWQTASGVPPDGARDTPDVALTSAAHDGYLVVAHGGSLMSVLGTSAATPSFGAILALVRQRTGQRQGNPNLTLYQLGFQQYQGQIPPVFHDIAVGDNTVPGVAGFSCTAGYDLVTGLGSVDAAALVNAWPLPPGAKFRFSPDQPGVDQVVNFVDTSTGSPSAWSWDFGDPASGPLNTSNERSPSHAYSSPGAYVVHLSTTGPGGSSQAVGTVTVTTPADCVRCPIVVPVRTPR